MTSRAVAMAAVFIIMISSIQRCLHWCCCYLSYGLIDRAGRESSRGRRSQVTGHACGRDVLTTSPRRLYATTLTAQQAAMRIPCCKHISGRNLMP